MNKCAICDRIIDLEKENQKYPSILPESKSLIKLSEKEKQTLNTIDSKRERLIKQEYYLAKHLVATNLIITPLRLGKIDRWTSPYIYNCTKCIWEPNTNKLKKMIWRAFQDGIVGKLYNSIGPITSRIKYATSKNIDLLATWYKLPKNKRLNQPVFYAHYNCIFDDLYRAKINELFK